LSPEALTNELNDSTPKQNDLVYDVEMHRRLEDEFGLFQQLGYDRFQAVQQDFTELQLGFDSNDGQKILYNFEEGASGIFGQDLPRQKWKTTEQILKKYRKIFVYYWLLGDYSYLIQTKKGKNFIAQLARIARRSLPGWDDTHAKHSMSD
jgi:hypothetical protein